MSLSTLSIKLLHQVLKSRCDISHARAQSHNLGSSTLNRLFITAKIERDELPINLRLKCPASCLSFCDASSNVFSLTPITAVAKPMARITTRTGAKTQTGNSYAQKITASTVIEIGHQPQFNIVLNKYILTPYR